MQFVFITSRHVVSYPHVLVRHLFIVQHSCMEGAYKPWAPASKSTTEEDDCDFTDGPDCEVRPIFSP